eukprot:6192292-Pleurochrysis_carterae.AAC.1
MARKLEQNNCHIRKEQTGNRKEQHASRFALTTSRICNQSQYGQQQAGAERVPPAQEHRSLPGMPETDPQLELAGSERRSVPLESTFKRGRGQFRSLATGGETVHIRMGCSSRLRLALPYIALRGTRPSARCWHAAQGGSTLLIVEETLTPPDPERIPKPAFAARPQALEAWEQAYLAAAPAYGNESVHRMK